MKRHVVPSELLSRRVEIHLIGCGGNGCHMLMGLCQLHQALRGLRHPGIHVTAYDPDRVTHANLGRQLFAENDLGQNKALTLVQRVNVAFGLHWDAYPLTYRLFRHQTPPAVVISCVDTKQARAALYGKLQQMRRSLYWLDLGNGRDYGQVVLGELGTDRSRLANVAELHPEILEGPEDNTPSCSLAEALDKQDLFINRTLTAFALHLLWSLFRKGELEYQGCFLNLANLTVVPLAIQQRPRKARKKGA